MVRAQIAGLFDEALAAAARALAEEFTDHSGLFFTDGVCWFNGPWDTALGVLRATAGELDPAVDHLRRTVEQCGALDAVPFGVIARLELATVARLRGVDMSGIDHTFATEARTAPAEQGAERFDFRGRVDALRCHSAEALRRMVAEARREQQRWRLEELGATRGIQIHHTNPICAHGDSHDPHALCGVCEPRHHILEPHGLYRLIGDAEDPDGLTLVHRDDLPPDDARAGPSP